MPTMNSTFLESVQGFLKSKSVSHSAEWRAKSDDVPTSISSQFSIGVNSTATSPPTLEPPILFRLLAPPNSIIATGSLSTVCARPQYDKSSDVAIRYLCIFGAVYQFHASAGQRDVFADHSPLSRDSDSCARCCRDVNRDDVF